MTSAHVPQDGIPSAVVATKVDTIPYAIPIMLSMDPKISGPKPLAVRPLRMMPFGAKEPITFSEEELNRLGKKAVVRSKKQHVEIPMWLKEHPLYVEGDWEALVHIRSTNGRVRTDRFYRHRLYRKTFRSTSDVKLLQSRKDTTDIFNGRKLQRMKTVSPDGQEAGPSETNKRGRKNANSTSGANVQTDPIRTHLPPGFL
ncbi:unnamed protein product [Urochloa decumbens]|uniref:Uncharacterized protein n=1 Tax=Urochloa decumbens TaxID=240449 RepID=A0ABC8YE81_9POAL